MFKFFKLIKKLNICTYICMYIDIVMSVLKNIHIRIAYGDYATGGAIPLLNCEKLNRKVRCGWPIALAPYNTALYYDLAASHLPTPPTSHLRCLSDRRQKKKKCEPEKGTRSRKQKQRSDERSERGGGSVKRRAQRKEEQR